jgi:large subunit ribosomal protein L4
MVIKTFEYQILNSINPKGELLGKKSFPLIVADKAKYVVHRAIKTANSNRSQFTSSTKTRSEVNGGGRKPWKQKGTGRARAGSNRSPLWRGGGVTFGPRPKSIVKKINKKERRLAILSAVYLKKIEFIFLEEGIYENFNDTKTKSILSIISNLKLESTSKILFVLTKPNHDFWLATRNLKNVEVTTATSLNIEQLLKTNHIVLSNQGLELINSTYGKAYT